MSVINALFDPTYRLLVGVSEVESDGSVRVYLNARYTNLHTHVDNPDEIAKVQKAWRNPAGHQYVRVPDEALCDCAEVGAS